MDILKQTGGKVSLVYEPKPVIRVRVAPSALPVVLPEDCKQKLPSLADLVFNYNLGVL